MRLTRITPQLLALTVVLLLPACGGGGGGGSTTPGSSPPPSADRLQSSFSADVSFGVPADGLSEVQLHVQLADSDGKPLEGVELEFLASGFSNQLTQPALTDEDGRASGAIRTTVAELKSIQLTILAGAQQGPFGSLDAEFVRLLPKTFYVRKSGSDGNPGSAPLEAWGSLSYAIDQLQAGDTLYVGAGVYGPASMVRVATAEDPIRIIADQLGQHTGDPGQVVIDATGSDYGLLLDGACHIAVRGFSIHGALPGTRSGAGIWLSDRGSQGISIIDCALYENTRGLDVQRAAELAVEGCSISNNREDGIRLGLTDRASILNNLIYNNDGSGMNIVRLTGGLLVGLNTFFANQGPHVVETLPAGSAGSSAFVTGNLFMEGGESSVELTALSSRLFSGDVNLNFGNRRMANEPPTIGATINADPQLIDVDGEDNQLGGFGHADDDFSLERTSVALDAGIVNANQLRFAFSGPAAGKSSIFDGELDGQGTDGKRINLGYHNPGKLEPYTSAKPSESRISYVKQGDAYVKTALRPALTEQWQPGRDSQITNSGAKWLVHRLAPVGPEELMATLVDTGLGSELYLRHWDGRRWSEDLDFSVMTRIDRANVGERGFDLAYEQSSNDALFAYSNNDSVPMFRTLSKGVWSKAAPVFETPLGTGVVLWVELIPEAGSDRVALIALDDSEALSAAVWNGSSWESPLLLGTQIVEMREFHSFAGTWESISGDLMVMWGFSIFAEQARFAILDNQTKTWSPTQLYTNSEAVGSVVRLQSDPGSDRIAMAWGEGNVDDDVVVSTWDGDGFTNTRELSLTGQNGQQGMQVGWIGKTGKAFAIYRKRNTNTFERARFDRFWKFEDPINVPQMGKMVRAEIISDAGEDYAEVVMLDANGSLFGFEVRFAGQGTVWTMTNAGLPLAEGLSADETTQLFSANRRPSIVESAPAVSEE